MSTTPTLASKFCVKLLKPPKIQIPTPNTSFSDSLTHPWFFHSMLLALPGYQFPYTAMNRCFYLRARNKKPGAASKGTEAPPPPLGHPVFTAHLPPPSLHRQMPPREPTPAVRFATPPKSIRTVRSGRVWAVRSDPVGLSYAELSAGPSDRPPACPLTDLLTDEAKQRE